MLKKNVLCRVVLVCTCFLNKTFAQQIHQIDILDAAVNVQLIPDQKKIQGDVSYGFKVLESTDSLVVDARALEILSVQLNGSAVDYNYDDKVTLKVKTQFKKGDQHQLEISYQGQPNKSMYFI